jgi:hypothetical protein
LRVVAVLATLEAVAKEVLDLKEDADRLAKRGSYPNAGCH